MVASELLEACQQRKLDLKGRKMKEIPENVDLLQYLEHLGRSYFECQWAFLRSCDWMWRRLDSCWTGHY